MKDTQLGDYFIPKGRLIAASSWVNGNDPDLATNPEEVWFYNKFMRWDVLTCQQQWNPDRFFENQKFLQYFNPFGSGMANIFGVEVILVLNALSNLGWHPCMGEKIAYMIFINAIPRLFM